MKIKKTVLSYDEVMKLPRARHIKPKRPNILFRTLMKTVSDADIKAVNFSCRKVGMERLGKHEPCLYLMNHSSAIDLKIAAWTLYPQPFNIVCTSDGFVGKSWLMRNLGCIPTKKFVSEPSLVKDMAYSLHTLKDSVLMYPEASYSFDGTATPLPDSLGKCLKFLKVPVVMIKTQGAFTRDPLYNNLKLRNVGVSAEMTYLLSAEEIAAHSGDELNEVLKREFSFDNFRWQQENHIAIEEGFRAEGLNRVLYKCPHCGNETAMSGKDTHLTCASCGKVYELDAFGTMHALEGKTEYPHIPDWYQWERTCVRKELLDGSYHLRVPVTVCMMVDYKSIYEVGKGILDHSSAGFHLSACDGKIEYTQKPLSSYSLYADYYWYEIGDMICIGNSGVLYYCFPEESQDVVAKARIAAEELYKLEKQRHRAGVIEKKVSEISTISMK